MSYTNPFPLIPSASRIERIHHCPASLQMERAAPKRAEDTTHADLGNEVHGILSDEVSEDEASASAAQTAEMCEDATQRLLADWLMPSEPHLAYMELRYGLTKLGNVAIVHADSKADFIFTGQFDRLYIQGRRGLLVDFKALHGDHTEALNNPQLASLAVMVARRHNLGSVRVALVQPWKGKPTVAEYAGGMLDMANDWLFQTLDAATVATPDDRKAGKHCNYCKANSVCQTYRDANLQAIEVINPATLAGMDSETQIAAMWAHVCSLTPEHHAALFEDYAPMMKRCAHVIASSFKQRVEAGEIPGYGIREKKGKRSISDVGTVFSRAAAHGVTAEAFTAECSIALGALNTLLKSATGEKGKALEATTADVLRDATETSKGSTEVVKLTLE
jgi:hypothetical protein